MGAVYLEKYNQNHDPKDGKFSSGDATGASTEAHLQSMRANLVGTSTAHSAAAAKKLFDSLKTEGKSMVTRAYSTFEIKSINEEQRSIVGMASTPSTDRMGDIVEPAGAQFKLPIALLWHHDRKQPIGHVTAAKIGKNGIEITAKMPIVKEAGKLKDRLDEAWQSIKSRLVRGLSIGFAPIESKAIVSKDGKAGGQHYTLWDWIELSCVTIPANEQSSILSIKSFDEEIISNLNKKTLPVVRLDSVRVVKSEVPLKDRKYGLIYL